MSRKAEMGLLALECSATLVGGYMLGIALLRGDGIPIAMLFYAQRSFDMFRSIFIDRDSPGPDRS